MLRPQELSQNHEELFLQRYRWLLGWALQLTNHDRHKAENLVHDAFVQFVLSQPDLHQIRNLEAYLYTTLKNTHLSQARRTAKDSERQFSLVEYDSAELGLRQMDPCPNLQVQDELRQISRYAILRKPTSKAASVLILRFFHGYYPSEIARILRVSMAAVKKLLQMARAEARLFLCDPTALAFLSEPASIADHSATSRATTTDLLNELAETIFQSRIGACLGKTNLRARYFESTGAIESNLLSHLVSCRTCLDQVNGILGLPSLAERSPEDMTGNEPKDGSGTGGGPTASGSGDKSVGRSRRRLKETFEHYPKELRIAVNGFDLGSQKVNSELIEQDLKLNVGEPISFVEISSEQGLRLLLLNVEQPPEAPVEQSARIILSEDRKLEAALSFRSSWPTLHMLYHDPTFSAESTATREEVATDANLDGEELSAGEASTVPSPFKAKLASLSRRLFNPEFWLRPATVTALFALILAGVALFWLRHAAPPVSPLALLERSRVAEDALAARNDIVLHRTVNLEEKKPSGELVARRRLELWQSAEKGITARRLYDEKGQLIAGDWRRRDGVQTLYHHGGRPRLQIPNPQSAVRSFEEVWQLSLSAGEFAALIGSAPELSLNERGDRYVISYSSDGKAFGQKLLKATLVLARDDLRAIEQLLVISDGKETHEFQFIESSLERRTPDAVAPAIFDPEVELLGPTSKQPSTETVPAEKSPETSPNLSASAAASAALEVEVLRILSSAGADLGEQVNVTRTADGRLRVEGLVETSARKGELLQALHSVSDNPAVQIRISTVAETLSKQKARARTSTTEVVVEGTKTSDSIPAYDDLRRHFAARGDSGEKLEQSVQRLATRLTSLSYQTVQRAMALKRLAGRFSQEDLRAMDTDARAEWLALLRSNARTLQHQINGLGRELAPIFPSVQSGGGEDVEMRSDVELMRVSDRLFTLCSEYDRAIHAALTISPDAAGASSIKSLEFGRRLQDAERLAARISQYR